MVEKRLAQEDRISLRGILIFMLGLLVTLVLALLAMRVMFDQLVARQMAQDPAPSPLIDPRLPRLPPVPRLQIAPEQELQQMRAEEDELLRSYGWVDREAGRVRIPIDRAMDLLAERGLPARKPAVPAVSSEAK